MRLPRIIERIANGVADPLRWQTSLAWRAARCRRPDRPRPGGRSHAIDALCGASRHPVSARRRHPQQQPSRHAGLVCGTIADRAAGPRCTDDQRGAGASVGRTPGDARHQSDRHRRADSSRSLRARHGDQPGLDGPDARSRKSRRAAAAGLGARRRTATRPPTPNAAKAGSLAPFGEAKGYALGLAFELLVTGLTASAIGRDVRGTLDSDRDLQQGRLSSSCSDSVAAWRSVRAARRIPRCGARRMPADGLRRCLVPGDRAHWHAAAPPSPRVVHSADDFCDRLEASVTAKPEPSMQWSTRLPA